MATAVRTARAGRIGRPGRSFRGEFDDLLAGAYALARELVGAPVLAEEIAVDALARLRVDWAHAVRAEATYATLTRNVVRRAIDAMATREPLPTIVGVIEPPAGRIDHDIAVALRRLPRRRREIVALVELADCEPSDAARIVKQPLPVIERELRAGRAALAAGR